MKREQLQRRMAAAYGDTEVSTSDEPEQLSATEAFQRLVALATKGNRRQRRRLEQAWAQQQRKRVRRAP